MSNLTPTTYAKLPSQFWYQPDLTSPGPKQNSFQDTFCLIKTESQSPPPQSEISEQTLCRAISTLKRDGSGILESWKEIVGIIRPALHLNVDCPKCDNNCGLRESAEILSAQLWKDIRRWKEESVLHHWTEYVRIQFEKLLHLLLSFDGCQRKEMPTNLSEGRLQFYNPEPLCRDGGNSDKLGGRLETAEAGAILVAMSRKWVENPNLPPLMAPSPLINQLPGHIPNESAIYNRDDTIELESTVSGDGLDEHFEIIHPKISTTFGKGFSRDASTQTSLPSTMELTMASKGPSNLSTTARTPKEPKGGRVPKASGTPRGKGAKSGSSARNSEVVPGINDRPSPLNSPRPSQITSQTKPIESEETRQAETPLQLNESRTEKQYLLFKDWDFEKTAAKEPSAVETTQVKSSKVEGIEAVKEKTQNPRKRSKMASGPDEPAEKEPKIPPIRKRAKTSKVSPEPAQGSIDYREEAKSKITSSRKGKRSSTLSTSLPKADTISQFSSRLASADSVKFQETEESSTMNIVQNATIPIPAHTEPHKSELSPQSRLSSIDNSLQGIPNTFPSPEIETQSLFPSKERSISQGPESLAQDANTTGLEIQELDEWLSHHHEKAKKVIKFGSMEYSEMRKSKGYDDTKAI